MKSHLLSAVCACIFSVSANAAVVLFDTTEIVFNAGGSANTIAGGLSTQFISASAVPIPATAWLFGSGLLSLVGFSKSKKA